MLVYYMIEAIRVEPENQDFFYRPIGVWAVGGGEIATRFFEVFKQRANTARAIANKATKVDKGLLEYIADTTSAYVANHGPIKETRKYDSPAECADAILREINEGKYA